jgi:hypothetical protein
MTKNTARYAVPTSASRNGVLRRRPRRTGAAVAPRPGAVPSSRDRVEDAVPLRVLVVVLEDAELVRRRQHGLGREHQRAVRDGRVVELVAHVVLGRGHRADVVDVVLDDAGDPRRVVEVHPGKGRQRVRGLTRDHHVVVPGHLALVRCDELQVREPRLLGLEHVARPGLGDPGVAVLQPVDVALVVEPRDARSELPEPGLRLPPVGRSAVLRGDAERQQRERTQLGVVAHQPDAALERRVLEVLERGDPPTGVLRVVREPREPGLPDDGVRVARVVVRVLHRVRGVLREVRQPAVVELADEAVLDHLGELVPVRHHDDVVPGAPVRPEDRRDGRVERRVVLDDGLVVDVDPRLLAEEGEGLGLAVVGVDVERPVGEVQLAGRLRRLPERRPVDVGVR